MNIHAHTLSHILSHTHTHTHIDSVVRWQWKALLSLHYSEHTHTHQLKLHINNEHTTQYNVNVCKSEQLSFNYTPTHTHTHTVSQRSGCRTLLTLKQLMSLTVSGFVTQRTGSWGALSRCVVVSHHVELCCTVWLDILSPATSLNKIQSEFPLR